MRLASLTADRRVKGLARPRPEINYTAPGAPPKRRGYTQTSHRAPTHTQHQRHLPEPTHNTDATYRDQPLLPVLPTGTNPQLA